MAEQGRERIEDFDWLGLAYGITKLHVESLQSSTNILDVAPQQGVAGVTESSPVNLPAGGRGAVPSDSKVSDVAPELSATTGGIREKEDGACAECIPSSPGKVSDVADVSPVPSSAGGGVAPPSSPLHQFAGERGLPQGTAKCEAVTSLTSLAIHSGDTIERLINTVAICAERNRHGA